MRLGVDIGGTAIKFGILDDSGTILHKEQIATNAGRTDRQIVDDIIAVGKKLLEEYPVISIGIGSAGLIDAREGLIKKAVNLPFFHTPIKHWIEEELRLPTYLDNDANCAAWGEMQTGEGKGTENFIMISLGTGIGGGIIINKRIYYGSDGTAGEFGHMSIQHEGRQCVCGRKGCWEQYASTAALVEMAKEAIKEHPSSLLAEYGEDMSGKTIFEALERGCHTAEAVFNQYLGYLADGLMNVVNLFRPDKIILAGGITNQGERLLNPLRDRINSETEIAISKLKNDAGITGAALLYLREEGYSQADR